MNKHKNIINGITEFYKELVSKIDNYDKPKVEGYLSIKKNKNFIEHYHCYKDANTNKLKREYIGVENIELAKALAQKTYLNELSKTIKPRLDLLLKLNDNFNNINITDSFQNLSDYRKTLLDPVIPIRSHIINNWLNIPYISKPFYPDSKNIITNKGEKVRSKTEKILADLFYSKNIPYKYECPLKINNITIYPDFTFINPNTNEEIYWEHFGMIDVPEYAVKMMKKIILYETNNLRNGDKLIITMESSNHNLDYEWVNCLIDTYLIPKNI